nr:NLR family CARD domain-containing protein 3 [Zonotrichia albicollis]
MEEPMVQKHLESLQSSCGNGLETGALQRLTNLLLVEGLTDIQQKEHDILQVETTKGLPSTSKSIPLEKLFLPLSKLSIPPRISVTVGVAGIGKSTLVKLFVCSWAKGEISRDILFVLPLTFKELNTHEKLSAERLLSSACPPVPAGAARTLLILDGLDEFKTPLDFSNAAVCTDPKKEIQVDNLITNIIRGNLLQEASVWVTARPAAAGQIPSGLVDRMTEIRGFGAAEMKDFLDHMFLDNRDLSSQVLQHIRANRSLHVLCTIPGFCRISASSVAYFLKHSSDQSQEASVVPRTLSEIYSYYFKMALSGDWQEKPREALRIEQAVNTSKKLVGSLGRLAFSGLLRRKHVFYEQDMKAHGIDLSLLHSCLCTRLLLKEDMPASTAYYFSHLTIQEFLARKEGDSWSGMLGGQTPLSSQGKQTPGQVATAPGPAVGASWPRSVSHSLQHNSIKEDGAAFLAEALLTNHRLLTLHLQKNAVGAQGARTMAEALKQNCSLRELILSSNSVGDSGSIALAEALRVNHSLQCLDLQSNSISSAGVTALTTALCSNRGLLSLNLRENSISREGGPAIARALRSNSTLKKLDLAANLLGDDGGQAIASAIGENRALTSLHLQWNFIQAKTATALAQALQSNSSLVSLDLQENTIGDEGMAALSAALKVNTTLADLHLQVASVGAAGAQALAEALMVNKSLQVLDLRGNSLGPAGAKAVANALKVNRSLRWLNLQENALGMDGAICIATALKGNHGLTYVNLQGNLIGDSGARMIADTIRSNAPDCVVDV